MISFRMFRPVQSAWRSTSILCALVVASAILAPTASAATRTWVSGSGDDANPCSRTAPCKTLAGTISKTDAGGEINALDPGGFGAVTITKAITIDLTPGLSGVLVSGVNGIVVSAASTDDVVLRGIDVFGSGGGVGACPYASLSGIKINTAHSVTIEDSRIAGFSVAAINIDPDTASTQVLVDGVDIRDNCGVGIDAAPTAGQSASVMVRDTTIHNSGIGVHAGDKATVWLWGSTIFGNTLGLQTTGTGAINAYSNNQIIGNTTNGSPTTVVDPAIAGPQGPAGATVSTLRLLLAMPSSKVRATTRHRVTLSYLVTTTARSTLTIRRGHRIVATVKAKAHTGRNSITWNGKIRGKFAAAGVYKLSLQSVSTDGQKATVSGTVRLIARSH